MKKKKMGFLLYGFLVFLYLVIRYLRRIHQIIPFVNSYLNDILCLPIILGLVLFIIRKWVIRNPDYYFSIYHILFTAVVFSLYFEWYLPQRDFRFTSDFFDVLAYFSGGILFFLYFQNAERKSPLVIRPVDSGNEPPLQ